MSTKIPDLTGQAFGLWSVIAPAESDKAGRKRYLCRCSCGKERVVTASDLRRGTSTSCGHTGADKQRADLTGMRFNRLTAVSWVDKRGKNLIWECICDCGNTCLVAANNLRSGHTQSCGCKLAEAQRDPAARLAGQATSIKCGKIDTNARAKRFILTCDGRKWVGRNLSNFVRTNYALFDIPPGDEHRINRVAQELYTTRRNNTSWHGWRLRWEDDQNG